MNTIMIINIVIGISFFCCYAYQLWYLTIPFTRQAPPHKPEVLHRFAVLICARNEREVIGELIRSIQSQTYDQSLLTIFVMADNCTDDTAEIARQAGAVVYVRENKQLVGKGYALEQLLCNVQQEYPQTFDGFFVFDADNILKPTFIEEMNRTFTDGYEVVTSYRNSKNYGDNWISAGYALWFLRESRYLNNSRMLTGHSCAISGTGFLFSRRVLESTDGWKFHLLTEDIEFSVYHILEGRTIGFCPDAVLYDEQPVTFRQSWRQRLRWSRGFLQVFHKYGARLMTGVTHGSFSCYDMSMTVMPAFILTTGSITAYIIAAVTASAEGVAFLPSMVFVLQAFGCMYLALYVVGLFTTVTEWDQIHTTKVKKVFYTFTFPVFMLTYIPISVVALFTKVQWKPIEHHAASKSSIQLAGPQ